MEIKMLTGKFRELAEKYKYAIAVLLIGLALLLIPGKRQTPKETASSPPVAIGQETSMEESLTQILQTVAGAGKVRVLLSMATGEETVYQTDIENTSTSDGNNETVKTVVITDSERCETGLVRQVNPAAYRGAVVVCQGADSPAVRLAVTQAVSRITGLGTDAICVLKMQ